MAKIVFGLVKRKLFLSFSLLLDLKEDIISWRRLQNPFHYKRIVLRFLG